MTLDDIKARCFIDDQGCWLWRGAMTDGKWPRIHGPDHTKPGSPMGTQTGRRAVWHLKTGQPIPKGWRVYGTCQCDACVNPEHMKCGTTAEMGRFTVKLGRFKNSTARIVANRKTGQKRSRLNLAQLREIQQSSEFNRVLAEKWGVSHQTISRARRGLLKSIEPANPFLGLMR